MNKRATSRNDVMDEMIPDPVYIYYSRMQTLKPLVK